MSAAEIDAGSGLTATTGGADDISRRLESLPTSSYVWRLVILLSLGGCFEIYDLFLTGYIAPGLNRSGLLTTTTQAFFGFSGIGAFVAATFAGLFVGTFFLGFLADRFGRRSIFTYALLGYTAASVAMACQTTSEGVLLWRFIAGIGIGVEIITIDSYIGSDNYEGGKIAGNYLLQATGGKANVGVLEGIPGHETGDQRLRGFKDAVKDAKGIKIVASQTANWERDQGFTVFQNMLEAHPEIDAVFSANDMMALGAVEAIAAKGKTGKIKVVGYDAVEDAKKAIAEGTIVASVAQFPSEMGRVAVESADKLLKGQAVPAEQLVRIDLVTKDKPAGAAAGGKQ